MLLIKSRGKIFFETLYYGLFYISERMCELQTYVKWVTLYIASVHASDLTMSRDVSAKVNRLILQAFYSRQTCELRYNIIIVLYIVILLLSTISSRWWVTSAHGDRSFLYNVIRACEFAWLHRATTEERNTLAVYYNK